MALRDFTKLHVVYAERSLFDRDIVYLYTSNGGLILVKNARDRQGNPIERDPDEFTTLDFLAIWVGKLRRANSALYEVSSRIGEVADGGE